MSESLLRIFQESYRELKPRAPMPEFSVEFFAFANINNTIRLREGTVLVSERNEIFRLIPNDKGIADKKVLLTSEELERFWKELAK